MLFNVGTWPSAINDPTEARDRYHLIALHEARIAAEQEPHRSAANRRGLIDRMRAAIGLAPGARETIACATC
ncbi:MAG: hypothetical protein HY263_03025 [Chloroflexi bacterium]|nr:hypothetical protein [Chloroflexota bacterium]